MNQQHHTTFTALFELLGLSKEGSKQISYEMANTDNGVQDRVIALLSSELVKRQNLVGKPEQK